MLTDATVVAFVATVKPQESLAFYRDTLGLTLIEESPYAIVFRAGATMLRVQLVHELEAHPFTALGWDVADIRATVEELRERGVVIEPNAYVQLDDDGIWWTPNGDGIAWFKDPDGNTLSLTQFA